MKKRDKIIIISNMLQENANELISDFLERDVINALPAFIEKADNYEDAAEKIAEAFGASAGFAKQPDDEAKKLVLSFKHNLTLLIQKTWVEKSDIALKDRLLYQLEQLSENVESAWKDNYPMFLEIIDSAIYLMFGQQAKSQDFFEYSLRIDPMFGIFWWYIGSLPMNNDWSEAKSRMAILIGMYFLANY